MADRPPRSLFAALLVTGIVLPGVLNYFLTRANYDTLGTVVWVVGYLTMVGAIWYGWIRPLDLTGPDG